METLKPKKKLLTPTIVVGIVIIIVAVIFFIRYQYGGTETGKRVRCENSGGEWSQACANNGSGYCTPGHCVCNCGHLGFQEFEKKPFNEKTPRGLVQTDLSTCGVKTEENGQCKKKCHSDLDCPAKSPNQDGAYCFEYEPECIKGVCYNKRNIYFGYTAGNKCADTCGNGNCEGYEKIFCSKDCE